MSKKVLVIDDSVDLLRIVRLALMRAGFDVLTARNGQEGLAKSRKSRPALILLDLMMPEMDGYSFLKERLRDPEIRDIPVVVLTARTGPLAQERTAYLGSARFLTKPVRLDQVVHAVKQHSAVV